MLPICAEDAFCNKHCLLQAHAAYAVAFWVGLTATQAAIDKGWCMDEPASMCLLACICPVRHVRANMHDGVLYFLQVAYHASRALLQYIRAHLLIHLTALQRRLRDGPVSAHTPACSCSTHVSCPKLLSASSEWHLALTEAPLTCCTTPQACCYIHISPAVCFTNTAVCCCCPGSLCHAPTPQSHQH